ncbi:hypothetical protein LIER_36401 [Lithospermum erythrorhizon]|uniref:DUF4283 domain-containing protein n=1 Tax=Lithospermum erythrorhizon TaxID=34254 RepID=A0AAV3P7B1_LITER
MATTSKQIRAHGSTNRTSVGEKQDVRPNGGGITAPNFVEKTKMKNQVPRFNLTYVKPSTVDGKLVVRVPQSLTVEGHGNQKPVNLLPIWVQFPHLSLDLWKEETLSMLASQLGKPLFADRLTLDMSRLSFTQVCAKVNVESELFDEIVVEYANKVTTVQRVVYEWVPQGCKKYKIFGHVEQGKMCEDVECKGKESEGKKVDDNVQVEDVCVDGKGEVETGEEEWQTKPIRKGREAPFQTPLVTPVNLVVINNVGSRYLMLNSVEEGLDDDSSQHTNEEEGENMVLMFRFLIKRKEIVKARILRRRGGDPIRINGYSLLEHQGIKQSLEAKANKKIEE